MQKGILGKKIGMTQLYSKDGALVPVTLIEAGPCVVLEVKNTAKNKYAAIKLGFGDKKEKRTNKADLGNFKKAKSCPKKFIREIRLESVEDANAGQEIRADIFHAGEFVDITGVSKGKGFQGGMKRWNWTAGKSGHGSMHHRRVGSIGASSFPSRVFRGKHMPGRMGGDKVTVQNMEVVRVDAEENLLVVKGTIPGHNNSYLAVKSARKIPCTLTASKTENAQQKG